MRTLLLTSAIVALSFCAAAQQDGASSGPAAAQRVVPAQTRPQEGKLVAIDRAARTVAIGPLEGVTTAFPSLTVFQVRTNTYILKSGKKAKLEDATVGEKVRYLARKGLDGKLGLAWMNLSPAARPATSGTK